MSKPVIVRTLIAGDWLAAFRIVFAETFAAAAGLMGVPTNADTIALQFGDGPTDWPARRGAAMRMGLSCAEADRPELACAWALLAIDPKWKESRSIEDERAYVPPFAALADAIAHDASLLHDDVFCRRVMALRFLAKFGIGGPVHDPIAAVEMLGVTMEADRDELLAWARRVSGNEESK